jgi:aspergillopepsin I
MPSFGILTAALALAGTVAASPVQTNKGSLSSFSVNQVARSSYLKNGPEQKIKTLRKYGKAVPQSLIDAAEKRANAGATFTTESTDGSVPAVPESYDASYLSPVTIGSKTVHLDFDTGSADL